MGEVIPINQRLVCTCCDWRWPSQERYDDHILYMQSIGIIDNEEDDLS
jgi:hypothetical protein